MSGFLIRQSEEPTRNAAPSWIAEVSHELRLPIANIKLLVETLLDGALEDPETARRMLKRAHKETERLQLLVADLLSLEQVSQTRHDNQRQWNNLADRVQYAANSVASRALSKGVTIVVKVNAGFQVFANSEQLDQVLLNLVENAVKFTAENGSVTIGSGEQPGSFYVEDTGIGMATSEIPKIFQRFYRIDKTVGGTGLGLSIIKNIAELHSARLRVESEVGKGSKFTLEFPEPQPDGSATHTPQGNKS